MNYYVYKVCFQTGHFYFGIRSCECLPEEDIDYLGSPETFKNYWKEYLPCKSIIKICNSKEEAREYEKILISWAWSINKNLSLNACINGSKFCTKGVKLSEEALEKLRATIRVKTFKLVSPEGKIFEGKNIKEFCKINLLTYNSTRGVVDGSRFHHKGWTSSLENHKKYLIMFSLRGLCWHKDKKAWRLKIPKQTKKAFLGYYKDLEVAKFARDLAEVIWDSPYLVNKRINQRINYRHNE